MRGLDHNWEVTAHNVINEPTTVYNLTVEGAHTYFVGDADAPDAGAIWVHNTCDEYVRFRQLVGLDRNAADKIRAVNGLGATDEILESHHAVAFEAWRSGSKFVIDIPRDEVARVFNNGGLLKAYVDHLTDPVVCKNSVEATP